MDYLISTTVKNILLAAIDEGHSLTNLFIMLIKLFYRDEEENNFEYFQNHCHQIEALARTEYGRKKVQQLIQSIVDNFAECDEKSNVCISYRNLYVEIFNNAWHYATAQAKMKNLRAHFEAELEGWD